MLTVAHITPNAFQKEFSSLGDLYLGLAHLKTEFYKELDKPLYLDNGAFENGVPVGLDKYFHVIDELQPSAVFLPDSMHNAKMTRNGVKAFFHVMKLHKDPMKYIKIAVPQGKNEKEYWDQFTFFSEEPEIDMLGYSYSAIFKCFKTRSKSLSEARLKFLEKVKEKFDKPKDAHLLGTGDSWEDVIYARDNCPWIKSIDTSAAFSLGLQKHHLKFPLTRYDKPPKLDFDLKTITDEERGIIKQNILVINKWIHDT